MIFKLFGKNPKGSFFLALDIGTEAVKCAIFYSVIDDKKKEKIVVLGAGLEYFDRYGVYNSSNIESEIIKKAVEKSIEGAVNKISFSTADKNLKKQALIKKNWQVLVSLSCDILKARIVSQQFSREKGREKISLAEEKEIYNNVLKIAREMISDEFQKDSGILKNEIFWISHKILGIKIEGYLVSALRNYEGEDMEFKFLISFLPKYYYKSIKKIMGSLGFKSFKIVHSAENIENILDGDMANGVIVDVGAKITQIFGIKDGGLESVIEFNLGGKSFIGNISEILGLDEESSRIMAEKYSQGALSEGGKERIKEIFSVAKNEWYNNFKEKTDYMASKGVFLSNIFLLGGGSLLPDIKEVLKEKISEDSSFFSPKISFITIKNLKYIDDAIKMLDNPQWIPCLLLLYNVKK